NMTPSGTPMINDAHDRLPSEAGPTVSAATRETVTTAPMPVNPPSVLRPLPLRSPDSPGFGHSVDLQMEELVLDGWAPGERYRVADAIERELTRLFTERGAPSTISRGGAIDRVDCGTLEIVPGSSVEQIGVQLAKAIYAGVRR